VCYRKILSACGGDDGIVPLVLERTKRFSEGKSEGYTQEECGKDVLNI